MKNSTTITPQYPDFGALLESVKESGRRMEENYARYLTECEAGGVLTHENIDCP